MSKYIVNNLLNNSVSFCTTSVNMLPFIKSMKKFIFALQLVFLSLNIGNANIQLLIEFTKTKTFAIVISMH